MRGTTMARWLVRLFQVVALHMIHLPHVLHLPHLHMPHMLFGGGKGHAVTDPSWTLDSLKVLMDERFEAIQRLIDQRFAALEKALELQAAEYERRLETLNHEGQRINAVLADSVSQELYDEHRKGDSIALGLALSAVNKQFDDFVTRYELWKSALDQAVASQQGAQRQATEETARTGRRLSYGLAAATLLLAVAVFIANFLTGS